MGFHLLRGHGLGGFDCSIGSAASHGGAFTGLVAERIEFGAANLPRIEQQAGASEHVAGEEFAVSAFEDVAVFIADLAAGGVEVGIPRRCSRSRAETCEAAETTEKAAAGIESRCGNVDAGERAAVREFDGDEVFVGGGFGDVERRVAFEFELAVLAEYPTADAAACGDFDRDRFGSDLERVIAGFQAGDGEEAVFGFEKGGEVGSEGSGGLGEQGNGLKTRSTFRDAHRLAFDGLNRRRERAVGFFEGPRAAAAVWIFGGELFDAFEFAEGGAAFVVGFERDGLVA